jgi:hypothetical protein
VDQEGVRVLLAGAQRVALLLDEGVLASRELLTGFITALAGLAKADLGIGAKAELPRLAIQAIL